ncbi:tRNA 2-thiouridine(34) synthase MnmA [Candidatus Parcubacteria bacterium]|nr:tRNA 2-thiouridine(34) synthase MnmA [Candidatus Parcubacteria bacterium]
MNLLKKQKVVIALSGGIDSSVAAALLKKQDFEVEGVFMKLCDLPQFEQAEKRARKIAEVLGIPFLVLDLRKEFQKKVIDYFLKEYKAGTTPNPCVVCNKEIKFGILFKKLRQAKVKFDFLATGHYARISDYKILKAKDREKDQTYFLWGLKQRQLKKVLFPLGNYTRKQVKSLAKKFNLPTYKSSGSQEICFIPKTTNDFLKNYIKQKPGLIIDIKGKIMGEHNGLAFYTIGQRRGLGFSGGPYYVLAKDIRRNHLIITKNEKDLYNKELIVKNINWISGKDTNLPLKIKVKIRYRHKAVLAVIKKNKRYKVVFNKPQMAITPGQSAVFYQKDELLGGGVIVSL